MKVDSSVSKENLNNRPGGVSRSLALQYAIAFLSFAIALLLRWILEPILKNSLPLVTLYGAVAVAVWYSRWRAAAVASLLGYLAAYFLFISSDLGSIFTAPQLVGLITYTVSAGSIIYIGERMHRANNKIVAVLQGRKDLEETLAIETELLATTLASIGDAVIVTDTQGRITSINPEAERLTGWKNSDATDKPLAEVFRIVDERTRQSAEDPVQKALRDGMTVGLANHTVLLSKDGREIPIDDSAAPIRKADGPVLGVVLVFRDVTEQRAAQAARARLAAIVEFSGDAIVTKSLDGIIQSWNIGAQRLFGYTAEEVIGKPVTIILPPDRLNEEDTILQRIRHGHPVERLETIRVAKDGRQIPVSVSISPLKDAEGTVTGASKIIHDVSEIVAAREALVREKELLATTLASIGDGVIVTDAQSRVTFLNAEAERLTGWINTEASGRPLSVVFRIVNEQTRRVAENPVDKALRLGAIVGLANHTMLLREDGAEFLIDDSAAPIRDKDGSVFGVVLVFRDVTAQRRAHEAREQLAAIVEYSGEAIATKNLDGIIQTWNASAEKLFGYKADEIIGKPVTTIIPPERLDEEEEILSRIRRGLPAERLDTVRLTKDGRRIPVSLTVSPLKDKEGNVTGASKLIQDITGRKRIDEQRQRLLAREQSLRTQAEAAGRMRDEFLATVSHELRTPLNAILGWATTLNRTKLDKPTERRGMEAIERNARAQAQLIEDLLDVSRIISGKMRLNVKPVVLTPIVEAAIDSVRPAADAKSIRLEMIIDPDANHLRADEARLQQIIWNLLSNSIKFTSPGGFVQVTINRTPSATEISVSDTGEGIKSEFLPFVFDRFQQADSSVTRKHGGLGLGLAITRHLVEMHGGTIKAESDGEGHGAKFTVKLPLQAVAPQAALVEAQRDSQAPNGTDRRPNLAGVKVLAVDDSGDTRELIKVLLETCGAKVTTASSVREALDVFTGWQPEVLICDIGMPEEDGYGLIKTIRQLPAERGGDIPAIALTGYVRVEDRMRALEAGYQIFVPKPIEATELCTIIATLVDHGVDTKQN
ncbi:MAG TPA: PAS domain S-box protein [Pyrinomonadaceae bacterium]|nr:PAS domain S-box protein [Pyrinomonadaceae bacterium]